MTKRILITGLSGVGKSSAIHDLRGLGFPCIDMDDEGWSYMDEAGHQRWHVNRLFDVIHDKAIETLYISGCSEDQKLFYGYLDAIILLSAPTEVMVQRILSRIDNPYGKRPAEMAQIMKNHQVVWPLLRKACTQEISTDVALSDDVKQILSICNE